MKAIFHIFFFVYFLVSLNAQKESLRGEGWKAWKHLEKTILEYNEEESIALCSGRMREGIFNFGMENIVKETRNMRPTFIREFTNKKKDTLYLITEIHGRDTVLIFKKQKEKWLFDDQNPGNFHSAEEAEKWQEIAMLKYSLEYIAKHVATHFSDSRRNLVIPKPESLSVSHHYINYINPETQKSENILVAQGVDFQSSPQLLLAVSEKPVFGKYYASFEDGRVQTISKEFLQLNADALGLNKNKIFKFSPEQLNALDTFLNILIHGNYKERKKAKQEFIDFGPKAIPYLKANLDHENLEVRLTIKELLKYYEGKALHKRPKLSIN